MPDDTHAPLPAHRGDWSLYGWALVVLAVGVPSWAWCRTRVRLGPPLPRAASGQPPAAVTRWRIVRCPRGTYAVLSDRAPGPRIGVPGELETWRELSVPPVWMPFRRALAAMRAHNDAALTLRRSGVQNAAERATGAVAAVDRGGAT